MARIERRARTARSLTILLVGLMVFTLGAGWMPRVQGAEGPSPDAPPTLDAPYSVGVEWVAQFTTCSANNLPNCTEPECMKLYNTLVNKEGWTGEFHWGDSSAWETDFKRAAAGGSENSWIDSVDLGLFCSHGSGAYDEFWNKNLSSLYFGDPHNDCHLTPGEAYKSYGDYNLEWLAVFACSVLSDGGPAPYYNRGYWASTMDGLHLLLAMKTTMYCSSQIGQKWADYMRGIQWPFWPHFWLRPPYKITQAWFEAVDDTQPGGVCARVLAEVKDNYNDYLWGKGYVSPDPTANGVYWYWDHCSCTPPPVQVQDLDQGFALPVLKVLPREVNQEYVLQNIAPAWEMQDSAVYSDTQHFYLMQTTEGMTETLQIDKASGGYKYRIQSTLWNPPTATLELLGPRESFARAEQFFNSLPAENLPGVWYRNGDTTFAQEQMVEVQLETLPDGTTIEEELQSVAVDNALSWGRVIQILVGTDRGTVQQEVSIVGPGARTKMYLGDGGEILGVQGGSRDLMDMAIRQTVAIIPYTTAWEMFLEDPNIALATIPWAFDEVTYSDVTIGYYEQPQFQEQQELIPAWIFNADFTSGGTPLAQGVLVYVPAATEYLPPKVQIDRPEAGATFSDGETVTFNGSVTQGKAPYTYEWYSSHDGLLGSEATSEASLSGAVEKGELISHTISLQVTDANGQEGADSRVVFVRTAAYLPIILREP
ncbi:MAG: DUF6345 domain-containing protein [Anaerolineae bacterium]